MQGTHYRPDIDGLRALAVLAVVFFHVGFVPRGSGYVGVDVFFVISGSSSRASSSASCKPRLLISQVL